MRKIKKYQLSSLKIPTVPLFPEVKLELKECEDNEEPMVDFAAKCEKKNLGCNWGSRRKRSQQLAKISTVTLMLGRQVDFLSIKKAGSGLQQTFKSGTVRVRKKQNNLI